MPGKNGLRALLALFLVLVALSGCGSDEISGEIPPANAAELTAALEAVTGAVAVQNCDGASASADEFVAEVNLLPADAGEAKTELQGAGDRLRTLVDTECPATGTSGTTQSTTSTSTTTTPTTTEPTTTDTTTTDTTSTTSTTSTDTDQTPPPGNGGGDDGGSDGGTGGTGGGGTGD